MRFSPLLDQLIQSLQCLPGVGPKSAQRMAFYLLERNRRGASDLADVIKQSLTQIGKCTMCRNFSEAEICRICANVNRETTSLCVVESPADVIAIEQTGTYRGLYFVLLGRLSPIDGIGPEDIGVPAFEKRLSKSITEVIMATNTTVEGEATAYYLAEITKARGIKTTRIAHGVPLGGELEHFDGGTLSRALLQRDAITS